MKTILITGAGKGIGLELVRQSVASGHRVVAVSRNTGALEKMLGNTLHVVTGDLRTLNWSDILTGLPEGWNPVEVLINNAGAIVNKPFLTIDLREVEEVYATNVFGVIRLIQDVIRLRHHQKSMHIVNISSMGGYQGSAKFPGLSVYSSSKGALSILSECLAEEFKEEGIRVNALCLGAVQTEMLSEAFPGYQAPIQPGEMAEFILDFALRSDRFINGKVIPVSISTP
ncbi:MAG TPA: SDR family oxidoreductase [Luteibaculaceae bacterium]|nr:SDR family oxidoreductase [Luteibaculaceae bacterium]